MDRCDLNHSIPFLDLVTPHREMEGQLLSVVQRALANAEFVGGRMLEEFEQNYAAYCDTRYCVGVGSGTDALRFALLASGVGRGDAVITVCNSFIATFEAIVQTGAQPIFVDVEEESGNIDPQKLQEFIEHECVLDAQRRLKTRRHDFEIKAIMPVHLYGRPVDMDPVLALARHYKLVVIEDACQAHGATYFSKNNGCWLKAGSMGDAAAFSFYPGKNLGACGEAGAVTTNDAELARQVRILRDHGQAEKYHHCREGYNGRLDAIQAGFLSVKLPYLEQWNIARRAVAQRYQRYFASVPDRVRAPQEQRSTRSVYHLYVIRVSQRDRLRQHLASCGIGTGIHYPVPLHLQPACKTLGYKRGDFPVAEQLASTVLSLPMFPHLRAELQQQVAEVILEFTRPAFSIPELKPEPTLVPSVPAA